MATDDQLDYRGSGVSIGDGDMTSRLFGRYARTTRRSGVIGEVGGFGGLFDLAATGISDPILVAGADGVGTKLLLAVQSGLHHHIGVDLVAMCVNDILTHGAEPLFFLDYFASGALPQERSDTLAGSIARGCRLSGCALLGGETAQMPDLYGRGHYDLAGFAVGAVSRDHMLPNISALAEGDCLIGLASSGLHANGFSLVRAVVERLGLSLDGPAPFAPEATLAEALLVPTVIYADVVLPSVASGQIKALAHITGGGLESNLVRVFAPGSGFGVRIDFASLPLLPVFDWLSRSGSVSGSEMRRVFNLGIGMVAVVGDNDAGAVMAELAERGQECRVIGEVVRSE